MKFIMIKVGLENKMKDKAKNLSVFGKKKMIIALSLLASPDCLLLAEPFKGIFLLLCSRKLIFLGLTGFMRNEMAVLIQNIEIQNKIILFSLSPQDSFLAKNGKWLLFNKGIDSFTGNDNV